MISKLYRSLKIVVKTIFFVVVVFFFREKEIKVQYLKKRKGFCLVS